MKALTVLIWQLHHYNKNIVDYTKKFGKEYKKLCLAFLRKKSDLSEIKFEDVLHLDRYSRIVRDYNAHCSSDRGEGIHNHCNKIPDLSGTELLNKTSIKGSHSYIITPIGANKMISMSQIYNIYLLSRKTVLPNDLFKIIKIIVSVFCVIFVEYIIFC